MKWIQDPKTGKLIPADQYEREPQASFYVVPDINPYNTVAADKETGKRVHVAGRKQHREFLRRNGYEEIGNEKFKPSPKKDGIHDRLANSLNWGIKD